MFKFPTKQSQPEPTSFDGWFAQTRKVHLGFMGGILVQAVIAYLLKHQVMVDEPGFVHLPSNSFNTLMTIFGIVSCVIIGVVVIILPKRSSIDHLLTQPLDSPVALGKALSSEANLRSSAVLAIEIFGLLLFFLNGNLLHFAIFATVAFSLLLLLVPRRYQWDEVLNVFRIARPEWRNLE